MNDDRLVRALKDADLTGLRRLVELEDCAGSLVLLADSAPCPAVALACKSGNPELLQYVLKTVRSAGIDAAESKALGGFAALHFACLMNRPDLVRLLVKSGANINLRSKGLSGETPLILCCKKGLLECAKVLVELDVDRNSVDNFQHNASFWCRQYNRDQYIAILELSPFKPLSFDNFLEGARSRQAKLPAVIIAPKAKPKKAKKKTTSAGDVVSAKPKKTKKKGNGKK